MEKYFLNFGCFNLKAIKTDFKGVELSGNLDSSINSNI